MRSASLMHTSLMENSCFGGLADHDAIGLNACAGAWPVFAVLGPCRNEIKIHPFGVLTGNRRTEYGNMRAASSISDAPLFHVGDIWLFLNGRALRALLLLRMDQASERLQQPLNRRPRPRLRRRANGLQQPKAVPGLMRWHQPPTTVPRPLASIRLALPLIRPPRPRPSAVRPPRSRCPASMSLNCKSCPT